MKRFKIFSPLILFVALAVAFLVVTTFMQTEAQGPYAKSTIFGESVFYKLGTAINIDDNPAAIDFAYRTFVALSDTGTVDSIIPAARSGKIVYIIALGRDTLTDGKNLKLSADFDGNINETLTLISYGSTWVEVARSIN